MTRSTLTEANYCNVPQQSSKGRPDPLRIRLDPDVDAKFNEYRCREHRGPTNAINVLLRIAFDALENVKEAS